MVSRLSLAIQYSITVLRGHRRIGSGSRKAVLWTIGFHLVFALTYLGVSFYTTHNPKSNVFTFWYYAALVELIIHSLHARLSSTLSFLGTHLTERLNLLTLIILGEGIIIITKKVAVLVENTWIKGNETSWSPALIGTIASAAGLAYIIFQLYFDWMHEDGGSNLTTHILWILFHMPFHISLVLLVEGGNQFIVWRRAIEAIDAASATLEGAAFGFQQIDDTKAIVDRIKEPVMSLLDAYKPSDEVTTLRTVNDAFSDMETIPNEFWSMYEQLSANQPVKRRWLDDISKVISAVFNGINNSFEITDTDDNLLSSPDNDFISVVKDNGYGKLQDDFGFRSVESDAYIATTEKFRVVFVYTFVCAGLVLALLVALHLLSKRQRWTHFNTFKTTFSFMIALLLSVISLLSLSTDALTRALMFPWQLPVIAVSYFIALVLTHIRQPSHIFLAKLRGNWVKMKDPKPTTEKEKDSSNFV
ncbi:hypothetical protein SLS62_005185 [Diatrype stigma]|uniref:Uncharacterized protein n=1 Tax=Diatrype stigma TaxID=117547 RepID=A0AAN9V3J3_9PEZI